MKKMFWLCVFFFLGGMVLIASGLVAFHRTDLMPLGGVPALVAGFAVIAMGITGVTSGCHRNLFKF